MKRLFTAAVFSLLSYPAYSAGQYDATAPVKELIGAAIHNFDKQSKGYDDYISEDRLKRLYAQDFATVIRNAKKAMAKRGQAKLFDYDLITYQTDNCPLTDIGLEDMPPDGGVTVVKVWFNDTDCLHDPKLKGAHTLLLFMVEDENGKPVIGDFFHTNSKNEAWSTKKAFEALVK